MTRPALLTNHTSQQGHDGSAAGPQRDDLRPPRHATGRRLEVLQTSCELIEELDPAALGVTYWFEAPADGGPHSVTVRLRGRRDDVGGRRAAGDVFDVDESIDRLPAGVGRVALTRRFPGVNPGSWTVIATAVARPVTGTQRRSSTRADVALGKATASGHTFYTALAQVKGPGMHLGAWPGLVTVGAVVGLAVQWWLARGEGLPAGRLALLSLIAAVVGLIGSKAYYLIEHRAERPPVLKAGMCIQGFVLTTVATLLAGGLMLDIPLAESLDVSAPGLLIGMTVGRFGCFFSGCCAGRPTTSRWGLWSSDRTVAVRRIPTQLMEAALAGSLALVAIASVRSVNLATGAAGAVFVGTMAAYTLGRQLLLPLRSLPRHTRHARQVVLAVSVVAIFGAMAAAAAT